MDKTEFADILTPWWLVVVEIEPTLVEPRKDLAEALGYDRESQWYLEQWKLEGLYDVLETQDRALLTELDEAIDEYKRLEWLDRATKVLNTALGHAVNEEPTTTLEALPDAPTEESGSAAPSSSAEAPAAKPSPFKPSPFKKTAAAEQIDPQQQIEQTVQTAMAELKSENLASLAQEMNISEEKLQALLQDLPDNFEEMIVEQVKALSGS